MPMVNMVSFIKGHTGKGSRELTDKDYKSCERIVKNMEIRCKHEKHKKSGDRKNRG